MNKKDDNQSSSSVFLRDRDEETAGDIEIDYAGLEDASNKDFSVDESEPLYAEEKDSVAFYCRDCKKTVDVKRITNTLKKRGKKIPKMHFECEECNGTKVLYGTLRGISKMFHLSI